MAGGKPPKPIALVRGHRTKAEIELRQKEESKLFTGIALKEWPEVAANKKAHMHFTRIKKLLKIINKNDALHEPTINRYCMLIAECNDMEEMLKNQAEKARELSKRLEAAEIEFESYLELDSAITNSILAINRDLMSKRKMLLDIEKENIMTIQSALRSIPKKPEKEKEDDPMEALLKRRSEAR